MAIIATKTRAQLVTMALDELGVTDAATPPTADEQELVDQRVDGLLRELAARGVVEVADQSQIPVEQTGPLAELLANECSVQFGMPKKSPQERLLIEQRLRTMTAANITNEPVRGTYY